MRHSVAPLVLIFLLIVTLAGAQTATVNRSTSEKTDQVLQTLTGCLQQGDDSSEFKLLADEGGVWGLRSDDQSLALYRGHTVTIWGWTEQPAPCGSENSSVARKRNNQRCPRLLTVLQVEKISDGCQTDLRVR